MIATSRMVVSRAICTGTDQTVVCTAKRGMILGDITSVMGWMTVGAVWTTGTVPGVHCTPRNTLEGHYTCNSETGNKVCLPGWTGMFCNQGEKFSFLDTLVFIGGPA